MKVIKFIVIVALFYLLASCASAPSEPPLSITTQRALIVGLSSIDIQRPVLAIHALNEQEKKQPVSVAKAYVISLTQLLHYTGSLEAALKQLQQLHTQNSEL